MLVLMLDGPVHSVKNLRKVRTECTVCVGGGGEGATQVYLDDELKIPQNN